MNRMKFENHSRNYQLFQFHVMPVILLLSLIMMIVLMKLLTILPLDSPGSAVKAILSAWFVKSIPLGETVCRSLKGIN